MVYWSKAITAGSETSGCTLVSNLSTASLRWAAVRKNHVDPAHNEEDCCSYATNFLRGGDARRAASFCKAGIDRGRILELIDSEIEAFNDPRHCAAGNELQALHLAKTVPRSGFSRGCRGGPRAQSCASARRTVSKRWLSAANQKRIPHYQRAMDCGAQVRDVRVTRRRPSTAVNPM